MKLNTEPYTLKPFKFPKDFCVIIDTNEQRPLFTPPPQGLITLHHCIPIIYSTQLRGGDYTLKGFEDKIVVERKQAGDLRTYVGAERKKTDIKRQYLACLDFAGLVIESSWEDIMSPDLYSRITPAMIEGTLASMEVKNGIHIFCNRDRKMLERKILYWFLKFYEQQRTI